MRELRECAGKGRLGGRKCVLAVWGGGGGVIWSGVGVCLWERASEPRRAAPGQSLHACPEVIACLSCLGAGGKVEVQAK